jgi:hypothetical protein
VIDSTAAARPDPIADGRPESPDCFDAETGRRAFLAVEAGD